MPYKDPAKAREYERVRQNKKRSENREAYNAYQREWYEKNREARLAKTKAWREKNPDKVKEIEERRKADPVRSEKRRAYHRDNKKQLRETNPDRIRDSRYRSMYGITLANYNALLEEQNGMCAICGRPPGDGRSKYLHVDHCHTSKKVRGLLCGSCNQGLGRFGHDVGVLSEAIRYLQA